eukprot:evm.model.NODE_44751_length_17074_cov_68.067116.2
MLLFFSPSIRLSVSTHSYNSSPFFALPPVGGALADPVDMGILVFTEKAVAEAFAAEDAYVKAGLVREWKVRPWTVVAGSKL